MSTKPADGVPQPETAAADAAAAPAAADAAEDIAALRAAAAELAALKAEGAAARKADRDARKRAQEEAEKSGELAKALETAKSRLAELEGIEPLAARWRAHEEAETKRLDSEAATLPEAIRALYADAASVEAKAKVLAAFRATLAAPGAQKAVSVPPALGAPPGLTAPDIEAALADPTGRKFAEIKARDPSAVAKFFAGVLGGKSAPSLGIGRFAPGGNRGA
jgi:colicin import membrane protein